MSVRSQDRWVLYDHWSYIETKAESTKALQWSCTKEARGRHQAKNSCRWLIRPPERETSFLVSITHTSTLHVMWTSNYGTRFLFLCLCWFFAKLMWFMSPDTANEILGCACQKSFLLSQLHASKRTMNKSEVCSCLKNTFLARMESQSSLCGKNNSLIQAQSWTTWLGLSFRCLASYHSRIETH